MKYIVYGHVAATTQEEVEADTPEEALDLAGAAFSPSVCHSCAENLTIGEVYDSYVTTEDGDVVLTSEMEDKEEAHRAKVAKLEKEIEDLKQQLNKRSSVSLGDLDELAGDFRIEGNEVLMPMRAVGCVLGFGDHASLSRNVREAIKYVDEHVGALEACLAEHIPRLRKLSLRLRAAVESNAPKAPSPVRWYKRMGQGGEICHVGGEVFCLVMPNAFSGGFSWEASNESSTRVLRGVHKYKNAAKAEAVRHAQFLLPQEGESNG